MQSNDKARCDSTRHRHTRIGSGQRALRPEIEKPGDKIVYTSSSILLLVAKYNTY